MSEDDLSESESKAIGHLVREELARKRLTRQHLADLAKISLSTLEKALSGQRPFTLATVVRIEEALHLPLRRTRAEPIANHTTTAPPEMGSYSHAGVSWLEGDYLTIRPSFSTPEAVYAYSTTIKWDKALSHLCFHESERQDPQYKQEGFVSVPHQSGYVYLVTNKLGQYRMVMLTRPIISGEMYGLLSTLQSGRGSHLTPVATPVVLAPVKNFGEDIEYGLIEPGFKSYERYKKLLKRSVDEPFVTLLK